MLNNNFQLIYKKGDEMPADYLSRNIVSAISLSNCEIEDLQDRDERLQMIRRFLISQELPDDPTFRDQVKQAAEDCFMEDGRARRIARCSVNYSATSCWVCSLGRWSCQTLRTARIWWSLESRASSVVLLLQQRGLVGQARCVAGSVEA